MSSPGTSLGFVSLGFVLSRVSRSTLIAVRLWLFLLFYVVVVNINVIVIVVVDFVVFRPSNLPFVVVKPSNLPFVIVVIYVGVVVAVFFRCLLI